MNTQNEIIEGLRRIMKAKGVKLTDISVKLDVPYRSIQNWFALKSDMPMPVFIAICNELGLSGAFAEIVANQMLDNEEDRAVTDTIEHLNLLSSELHPEARDWLRILQSDVLRLVQVICDQRIRLRVLKDHGGE
ncbi:helix-turn-helix domain-containing protein [Methylosinus sp. Sm6]|uniref:helix-turn-helix domain-containing protein n=1 Tax=Methylosinus sp. Sm6 TaxID=2866948 RepID=UPI001C996872|nr:helix-turn-helix domain-containing protein [Methylosinus sp. Sm6]MBY6244100.1 hypothetical protein [Methylosinus sp. Sm6]